MVVALEKGRFKRESIDRFDLNVCRLALNKFL